MKKFIAILMVLTTLLGIVSLTGCNKQTGNSQANFVVPEGGFDTNTPVTITFGHTMGAASQAILDKYLKE